ncbi:nuclear transcription factor Y subunit B-4-like [Apium graveolens]|uniref:nuclear transcription factor Y subunit B-4-like n=1 Tax=Apium graveolens TaxID=4045 RepID=UPI003D795AA3
MVHVEGGNLLPAEYVLSQMSRMVANDRGISAGAVISIQECVSKFIRFMTTQANTRCMEEKRTTITGEDVLIAMNNHGFYRYIGPLFLYLNHFRAYAGDEHPPLSGELPEI